MQDQLAVGIDIGGTKIALATVDEEGHIIEEITIPTQSTEGFNRSRQRIISAIEQLLQTTDCAPSELAGIGIGCAGPVNPTLGTIHNPYTLPGWEDAPIVQTLSDYFDLPTRLENDADAALLGEVHFGAGYGADPVVMLTFGTGVGGAAFTAGKLLRGARGQHPELGHIRVSPNGPECYCGTTGCLESIASGTAIASQGQALGYPNAKAVFDAARQQEPQALLIVQNTIEAIRTAVWNLAHSLLPQRIILGGGIMEEHYDLFEQHSIEPLSEATQFLPGSVILAQAQLGNRAGLVGAASLVLQ